MMKCSVFPLHEGSAVVDTLNAKILGDVLELVALARARPAQLSYGSISFS